MPRRFQRKRVKGWRMPEGAVYVGRGTKWGNPWRIGQRGEPIERKGPTDDTLHPLADGGSMLAFNPPIQIHTFPRPLTASDVVIKYRSHIIETVGMDRIQAELGGRDLVCWCKEGAQCHADVLLDLANPPAPGPAF